MKFKTGDIVKWKCKKDNYNKKYLTSEMLEMYYETLK